MVRTRRDYKTLEPFLQRHGQFLGWRSLNGFLSAAVAGHWLTDNAIRVRRQGCYRGKIPAGPDAAKESWLAWLTGYSIGDCWKEQMQNKITEMKRATVSANRIGVSAMISM